MPSLDPVYLPNLTRLGLIALMLAVSFVVAARFRHLWGTTPLAVIAGLIQVPQTILSFSLNVEVAPGVSVSPASVVFFPATLFAVLLVYVLEDEVEARRLVYGVVLANLLLSTLIFVGQPLFNFPGGGNSLGLDEQLAVRISRILIVGAALMAVDAFVLIRAFEWFGDRMGRHVLARSLFALGISLGFDALVFSPIAFGSRPGFGFAMALGFGAKVTAAAFYSLAFVFLLPWSQMSGEPRVRVSHTTGPITYKDRFQDLQKIAVRDGLTGVFNRAYFDHELQTQVDRVLLRGDRLLLLLIDLDSFKQVNDTYGHPAGDRVLSLFGEALSAVARQNDTVCRYGGEEFAILIAGGPVSIAPRLFERITEEVARLWSAASPPFSFAAPRFSVGGASVPEEARSAEALLALADQRLYASKHAGGNRLTIS